MVSSGICVALSCFLSEFVLLSGATRESRYYLALVRLHSGTKVSKTPQLPLHTSSNVRRAIQAQSPLALLVTCWTKLTRLRVEMALGVLLDVCCVREARQACHTVCKQAASCKRKLSLTNFTRKLPHRKHASQFTSACKVSRARDQKLAKCQSDQCTHSAIFDEPRTLQVRSHR